MATKEKSSGDHSVCLSMYFYILGTCHRKNNPRYCHPSNAMWKRVKAPAIWLQEYDPPRGDPGIMAQGQVNPMSLA
jgi:hypothetical protein